MSDTRHSANDNQPARRPRAWQRMLSGRRLDLLDPSPSDIAIEDIAHGLARVARWNGQTRGRARLLGGPARADRGRHRRRAAARRRAALAAGGPAARRAGVRDRRPHQPVQGRGGPRLQGLRDPPAAGHPSALRAARGAARAPSRRTSSRPTASPPTTRPPCWPASAWTRRRAISAGRRGCRGRWRRRWRRSIRSRRRRRRRRSWRGSATLPKFNGGCRFSGTQMALDRGPSAMIRQ